MGLATTNDIFGDELVAPLQGSMIFSRLHTRGCTPG